MRANRAASGRCQSRRASVMARYRGPPVDSSTSWTDSPKVPTWVATQLRPSHRALHRSRRRRSGISPERCSEKSARDPRRSTRGARSPLRPRVRAQARSVWFDDFRARCTPRRTASRTVRLRRGPLRGNCDYELPPRSAMSQNHAHDNGACVQPLTSFQSAPTLRRRQMGDYDVYSLLRRGGCVVRRATYRLTTQEGGRQSSMEEPTLRVPRSCRRSAMWDSRLSDRPPLPATCDSARKQTRSFRTDLQRPLLPFQR